MSGLSLLPPGQIETPNVLRKVAEAHRYLAELKGVLAVLPNPEILIDTLALQEATDSSAIENIISTLSEVYQSDPASDTYLNPASKEIHAYARALRKGYELIRSRPMLTNNYILEIQVELEQNNAGFRKLPGTVLRNEKTGEIVYTPPQDYDTIIAFMTNLEKFINEPEFYTADPLVKMAIIHHQFESIHPFYDGNGRTGRIINVLYLILQDLIDYPVLYISRYIIQNKSQYYTLLQDVRITGQWEQWILYMLEAVTTTSKSTLATIKSIQASMDEYKNTLLEKAPKIYSHELLLHLFQHPYSKIEYLMRDLAVSRNTVLRYLDVLLQLGLVQKIKKGRDNYYLNTSLLKVLIEP
jgi:Fic family protein